MTRRAGNISAFQFFCTVFVCRATAMFTFVFADPDAFPPGDRSVLFLPFALVGTLACVPLLLLSGKCGEDGLFALTDRLSPAVSAGSALVFTGCAVWSAAVGLVRLEQFMGTVMFSGGRLYGLCFLLLAAAAAVARAGTETVTRTGAAVLALLAGALLFVGAATAKDFDVANLEPPLRGGLWKPLRVSFYAAARTAELLALPALMPRVRGNIKKGLAVWFLSFGMTASALYTLALGVTGAYGERQTFRFYALGALAKAGVLERADALLCAVWVLCSLVRVSLFLLAAARFSAGLKVKSKTGAVVGAAALTFAVYAALSGGAARFSAAAGDRADEAVFCVGAIALPLLLYAAVTFKEKRRRNAE